MTLQLLKRLPRHYIVTNNIGGQIGKSTLVLMLSGFLSASPDASTIVIIDAAAPEISIFESFQNIFGVTDSDISKNRFIDGSPCLRAPKVDETSSRNLLVVKPQRDQIITWNMLVDKIMRVQEATLQLGYNVTHIITETNLQPTDLSADMVFAVAEYQALNYWTLWNRESMSSRDTYENLKFYEEQYDDRQIQFHFMHNPYQEMQGWTQENILPAVQQCYAANGQPTSIRGVSHFLALCDHAQKAKSKGFEGNEFWGEVYKDYIGENKSQPRPANLLPLFYKSPTHNKYMPNKFASIENPLQDVAQLGSLVDKYSGGLYSLVFKPHFLQISI